MTGDVISAFRSELRGAAVWQARSHQRLRRLSVVLSASIAAIVLVGGGIAAQSRWLSAPSSGRAEIRAMHDRFDHLTSGFTSCMAAHGAHRVKLRGGGWTYRNAAEAESACGAYVSAITLTCQVIQLPGGQPT